MNPGPVIQFKQWLPDQPYYENPGLAEANNCVPVDGSFRDYRTLLVADASLNARAQGAFAALGSDGTGYIYAGDATKVYIKSGSTWNSIAGVTLGTGSTDVVSFAQYNNLVLETNYADLPRFATVGGATFAAIAAAPKAKKIAIVNQFAVLLNTIDTTNGTVPHRLQWSAIDDVTNFPTPDTATATATQAGQQFLHAEFGGGTDVFGGDQYAVLLQKTAVTRMTYAGPPVVFQFDTFEKKRGGWFPNASIQVGGKVYFIASDGFNVTDGAAVLPIGVGRVDKTFLADCNQTFVERVTVAYDYLTKCIFWSYPSLLATTGTPDKLIIYNINEDRWSHGADAMEMIFGAFTTGYTLDTLDTINASLDALNVALDSPSYQGGLPTMLAFGPTHQMGTFTGPSAVARFESGESQINPDGYFFVNGIKPLVSGFPTLITAQVANRIAQDNAARVFSAAAQRTARTGICDFRQEVMFGTASVEITGGFEKAMGFQFFGQPTGQV